jgi:hypothetical protein
MEVRVRFWNQADPPRSLGGYEDNRRRGVVFGLGVLVCVAAAGRRRITPSREGVVVELGEIYVVNQR